MMTEIQKKMAEALGLTEDDFQPKPRPEERLDALETTTDDMILLMAELIGGE